MPAEQPLLGQGRLVVLGGVGIHLDDPSTLRSSGASAPMSMPSRRAIEERNLLAVEPLAFDLAGLQDLLGQGLQTASARSWKPSPSIRPISRPWRWRTAAAAPASASWSQQNRGQSGSSWDIARHPPHPLRRMCDLFSADARDKIRTKRGAYPIYSPHCFFIRR